MEKNVAITDDFIQTKIYFIRGQKVMLDRDLAEMYGVTTGNLNKTVKRNIKRFPEDFMFQLVDQEFKTLIFQNGISNVKIVNVGRGGTRVLPYAFTEQGVAMLSGILNSERAIDVNIKIFRIFTKMRTFVLSNKDVLLKLEKIEKHILAHSHELKTQDGEIETLFELVDEIRKASEQNKNTKRTKIGFKIAKTKK